MRTTPAAAVAPPLPAMYLLTLALQPLAAAAAPTVPGAAAAFSTPYLGFKCPDQMGKSTPRLVMIQITIVISDLGLDLLLSLLLLLLAPVGTTAHRLSWGRRGTLIRSIAAAAAAV